MTVAFDEFEEIDKLPVKPAGRKAEPSRYAPLIKELAESGKARKSKPISDVVPDNAKTSPAGELERELRRAGRQVGAKVSIRKSPPNAAGAIYVSFSAVFDGERAENGTAPEDVSPPEQRTRKVK